MDFLGIIIFIIFAIVKAMSDSKSKQRNQRDLPRPQFPERDIPGQEFPPRKMESEQSTKQQKPWWEEWDEPEEEEHFPPATQTKPDPVKAKEKPVNVKEEPVRAKAEPLITKKQTPSEKIPREKKEFVKKKSIIETKTSIDKKLKDKPKEERRKHTTLEQQETRIPRLDPEQVRQGIIWAEILKPPKAKRNKYRA